MVQTRSASTSPVKKRANNATSPTKSSSKTSALPLGLTNGESLRLVIAPKTLSTKARLIRLSSNAPDKSPKRFLFCPDAGLLELTQVEVPKHDPRCILFAPPDADPQSQRSKVGDVSHGYVNKSAAYMTATPYDPCFVLLPIVADSTKVTLFQLLDDILDSTTEDVYDLGYVLKHRRDLLEEALESICDTIVAGDEKMYRYSKDKTLRNLMSKAQNACKNGLPSSLEDRFVVRALEAPVLCVKREETTMSSTTQNSKDPIPHTEIPTPSESFESQSSAASTTPSVIFSEVSAVSSALTTSSLPVSRNTPEDNVPPEAKLLQRLLTAFKFIAYGYLSSSLAKPLLEAFQSPASGIDFTPLTTHLAYITKLRTEAAASIDISSFSRKRGSLEDEEDAEARAEKKRRIDEEEKRKKANISRGVKDLAKVDTKGMKKMNAFFAPKATAKGKG